jgi:P27 family predicted phage terminase small subunit
MGKPGFQPMPTRLKVLRGNPSKERVKKNEPQPRRDPLPTDAPEMLVGYAREEWDRVVPELRYLRLMTRVDTQPLAAYCNAYATWRLAVEAFNSSEARFQKLDRLVIRNDKGTPFQNPLIRTMREAAHEMVRYATEFGFTPSARTRLTTPPEGAGEESKFGDLVG